MKAGRDDKKGTEQQELQAAGGEESVQMEESTLCSLAFHLNEDTMCEIEKHGSAKNLAGALYLCGGGASQTFCNLWVRCTLQDAMPI